MVVVSFRLFPFLCCLPLIIISQTFALYTNCSDKGNFTDNSTYHINLNTLLSNLTSNTEIDYGFYNSSYGQNTDKVNAIGMCRGDLKPDACRSCLNEYGVVLKEKCPNQMEAIVYYEDCMLRYSNRSIFGVVETSPLGYVENQDDALEMYQFSQVLGKLMESLKNTAKAGDYRRKYATADVSGPISQHIYGLVQCTPDLSAKECDDCLVLARSAMTTSKIGAKVLTPSCDIRYETRTFYGPTADAPSPLPSPPSPRSTINNTSSKGRVGTCHILLCC